MIALLAVAVLRAPTDGTTTTCTSPGGPTATIDDPGHGIPLLGGLLNDLGNAVFDSTCTQDGPYRQAGLIKSSADVLASTPSPTVADSSDHITGAAAFLSAHTSFYVMVLFTISVAVAGMRIGWQQKWHDMEGLLKLLIAMAVFLGIGAGIVQNILLATDGYAPWVINAAGNGDYATNMQDMLGDIPDPAIGDVVGYLLVGIAWLAAGLQWLVLHAVNSLLPLAVGVWPLFAGIEAIQSGRPWRNTMTRWILALATYKFFVASFYAAAFAEMGTTTNGGQAGEAIILLLMASLLLPMLVKTFTPFGAPPGTGVGAAGVAVGAALAVAR
jgi:hypothetical protein